MKTLINIYFFAFAFFLNQSIQSQKLSATIESDSILIGNELLYKIDINLDEKQSIVFPDSTSFIPFELSMISKMFFIFPSYESCLTILRQTSVTFSSRSEQLANKRPALRQEASDLQTKIGLKNVRTICKNLIDQCHEKMEGSPIVCNSLFLQR